MHRTHGRRRRMLPAGRHMILVVASAVLLLMTSMTGFASADEPLVVDDDGAECPHANHTTIQSAVAAAQVGDIVLVCQGTYRETVTITTDGLRIKGGGAILPELDGQGVRQRGFLLDGVRDVTVEGFTIRNHVEDVALVGARDNTIRHNVVTSALDGIVLRRSSGNLVEANEVFGNTPPSGRGIHLAEPTTTGNVVRNNVTSGNGFGIQLASAGSGNVVNHNVASGNAGAGISNTQTEGSTITHNMTEGNIRNGIVVVRPHGNYAPLSATIEHNRSSGNGVAGIALVHGGGNTVSHNQIWGNAQDGIVLHESFDNTIEYNDSSQNGLDGIGIKDHPGNPLSARNLVRANHMLGNLEHDCHDETFGSGTAGTANTWVGNHAETENRPGLCIEVA